MKTIFLAFIFTCTLFLTANTYPFRVIEDALFLSELTFPYAKEEVKNLVLYLHDPTCVPCRSFKQEFHTAASKAKNVNKDPYFLSFGFVDVSQEAQVHKDLGIKHFPALFFFKDNELYHAYSGPLNADSILDWAQSCYDLPFKKLETLDNQEIFGSFGAALVLFGEPYPEATSAMLKAAKKYRNNVQLFRTQSKEFAKKYQLRDGAIVLISKAGFNETFDGSSRLQSIEASLQGVVSGLPTYLDNAFANTMETMRFVYYCYFTREGVDDSGEFKAMVSATRQLKLNQVKFCTANVDTPLGATLAEVLGIKKDKTPTVGILDTTGDLPRKYRFNKQITTEELVKFYEASLVLKKNPFYLVETISDDTPKRGQDFTITLNRDNFNKTVLEGGKSALVLYCAPIEIACRGFENTFRSLAYQLRDNNINVAKVDTSKNDVDEKIDTYPLLVWYTPDGDKRGTRYNGPTNINNIKRWMHNDLKVEFDD